MSALILKSLNALSDTVETIDYLQYRDRVLADGGEIVESNEVKSAISFANKNGINSGNAIAVVSPRWGIKRQGDTITKLYSLMGVNNDIDVKAFTSSTLFIDRTAGYNAININSSLSNKLVSNRFTSNGNLGLQVIHKPNIRDTAAAYGSGDVFGIAYAYNVSDFKKVLLNYSYSRNTNETADLWRKRVYSENTAVGLIASAYIAATPSNKFTNNSLLVDNSGITVFKDGAQSAQVNYNKSSDLSGEYVIDFTKRFSSTGVALAGSETVIAEIWAINNASASQMLELSKRAASKY